MCVLINYDPANGVPIIPKASSAQIKRNTRKRIKLKIVLCFIVFTFLKINSKHNPVIKRRIPAATKSKIVHLTSAVNCIAINGINNIIIAESNIKNKLLFCRRVWFILIYKTFIVK